MSFISAWSLSQVRVPIMRFASWIVPVHTYRLVLRHLTNQLGLEPFHFTWTNNRFCRIVFDCFPAAAVIGLIRQRKRGISAWLRNRGFAGRLFVHHLCTKLAATSQKRTTMSFELSCCGPSKWGPMSSLSLCCIIQAPLDAVLCI